LLKLEENPSFDEAPSIATTNFHKNMNLAYAKICLEITLVGITAIIEQPKHIPANPKTNSEGTPTHTPNPLTPLLICKGRI
jgi:hypothetical protein